MDNFFEQRMRRYNSAVKSDVMNFDTADQVEMSSETNALTEEFTSALQIKKENRDEAREAVDFNNGDVVKEDVDIQKEVAELQIQKAFVMKQMKQNLDRIKNGENIFEEPSENHAIYKMEKDEEGNERESFQIEKNGKSYSLTWGQILSGNEWGLDYSFEDTPISIQKRYVFEKTKKKLMEMYNLQIAKSMQASNYVQNTRRQAYGGIEKAIASPVSEMKMGHLSEGIVNSLMTRIATDADGVIEIHTGTVDQDVELKADYVVTRSDDSYKRGVLVDEPLDDIKDPHQAQAVQWTEQGKFIPKLALKKKQLEKIKSKIDQIDEFDDIVLINSPYKALGVMRKWKKERPPYGPDCLVDEKAQAFVIVESLKGLFSEDELRYF